ncbi:MAG: S8 family serine peptidase, partial [Chloroflexota bacterium]|nr:S8 family serine peptidase [Chloroflexota bacterium]
MQRRGLILVLLVLLVALAGYGGVGRAAWLGADPVRGPLPQATGGVTDPPLPATAGVSDAIRLAQGGNGAIVPGEVLVRFRPPPGEQTVPANRPATILAAAGVPGSVTRRLEAVDGFVVLVAPGDEGKAADLLTAAPDVIAASPNLVRHIHTHLLLPAGPAPAAAPNDPLYPVQWAYGRINAPPAWGFAQRAVTVAVLDTGLDSSHPEFSGRVVAGTNFVQAGQPPTDDNGHGTHVAGIVAAAGGNGIGGVGMAWQARIMPIKVADSSGNLTSEAWLNGIAWAVAHGAQVINMSFGGTTFSSTEQAYISDAWNHGVVLVASAGNSGDAGNPVEYPASYTNVVSVAATGPDNNRAYYSATNRFVTVAAPGGDAHFSNDPESHFIISTWPLGLGSNYQTGYAREIGTSQAAPLVSGLVALMFGTGNGWTNATVVDRITATATDLGPAGRDDSYGFGLINVAAAVGNP